MREILFRGKDSLGNWRYGNLSICDDGELVQIERDTRSHTFVYPVDPDTVCEYTGLVDKNGVEIFENDIVAVNFGGCIGVRRFVVKYEAPEFTLYPLDGWKLSCFGGCEVLGNIFDNPDF